MLRLGPFNAGQISANQRAFNYANVQKDVHIIRSHINWKDRSTHWVILMDGLLHREEERERERVLLKRKLPHFENAMH